MIFYSLNGGIKINYGMENRTMSKAEDRALEKYPDYKSMDGGYVTQIKKRKCFVEGYHQAEKDNELTWEDMRELHIIFAEIDVDIDFFKTNIKKETLGYYQEVLKRFKDFKERKEK